MLHAVAGDVLGDLRYYSILYLVWSVTEAFVSCRENENELG